MACNWLLDELIRGFLAATGAFDVSFEPFLLLEVGLRVTGVEKFVGSVGVLEVLVVDVIAGVLCTGKPIEGNQKLRSLNMFVLISQYDEMCKTFTVFIRNQ